MKFTESLSFASLVLASAIYASDLTEEDGLKYINPLKGQGKDSKIHLQIEREGANFGNLGAGRNIFRRGGTIACCQGSLEDTAGPINDKYWMYEDLGDDKIRLYYVHHDDSFAGCMTGTADLTVVGAPLTWIGMQGDREWPDERCGLPDSQTVFYMSEAEPIGDGTVSIHLRSEDQSTAIGLLGGDQFGMVSAGDPDEALFRFVEVTEDSPAYPSAYYRDNEELIDLCYIDYWPISKWEDVRDEYIEKYSDFCFGNHDGQSVPPEDAPNVEGSTSDSASSVGLNLMVLVPGVVLALLQR
eukprot:Clim_evm32s235 gene=Clim_evmTU32s235